METLSQFLLASGEKGSLISSAYGKTNVLFGQQDARKLFIIYKTISPTPRPFTNLHRVVQFDYICSGSGKGLEISVFCQQSFTRSASTISVNREGNLGHCLHCSNTMPLFPKLRNNSHGRSPSLTSLR